MPVEVPFRAENNVAELVVDPELAAANESAVVRVGAEAEQAVVHASSCPGTSEVATDVEAGPAKDWSWRWRIGSRSEVGGKSRTTKQCGQGCAYKQELLHYANSPIAPRSCCTTGAQSESVAFE